jgi:hypothetical protein
MPSTETKPALTNAPAPYQDEVKILLSVVDGFVLENREVAYASSELTSGRRFYELCREYNVRTKEQLKEALGSDGYKMRLLDPNEKEAIEFARDVRRVTDRLALTPNTLFVPGWGQPEYLGFWETVIRTKCKTIFFNNGWEYSNGCTFEYLVGHEEKLPMFDRAGDSISVDRAKGLILVAINELESDRFAVPELRKVLDKL